MGYTTDFEGSFSLDKPLTTEHATYLRTFSATRRMKRDPMKAKDMIDPHRLAVGLPVGDDSEFFVGGLGYAGQENDSSVIEFNRPPAGQPGLWCQWVPGRGDSSIEWDGGEKFYAYVEWIRYLIEKFLAPWGYTLSGTVKWHGEDHDDMGRIVVENNKVTVQKGRVVWE